MKLVAGLLASAAAVAAVAWGLSSVDWSGAPSSTSTGECSPGGCCSAKMSRVSCCSQEAPSCCADAEQVVSVEAGCCSKTVEASPSVFDGAFVCTKTGVYTDEVRSARR